MIPQYQSTTNIKSHHYCSPILSSAPQPTFSPISTCQPCRHKVVFISMYVLLFCTLSGITGNSYIVHHCSSTFKTVKLLSKVVEWMTISSTLHTISSSFMFLHAYVILIFDFNYLKSKEYVILLFAFL